MSSNDPCNSPDDVFSQVPPPDLSRGDVSMFFEVVCLRSPCRLREMKVFDEAVLLTHRTGGPYGRAPPVSVSAKLPGTTFRPLVNFAALVTRFSSVIAGPFAIKT